ncbi:hypothetical protein [Thalassolituus marinus]|uniref:hypothetical protein n=1 Tax=Thalassolituus marinus TaxID=671053 RepID=UPI001CE2C395|nr:hypothetical protein [Thalassolituus marinus]
MEAVTGVEPQQPAELSATASEAQYDDSFFFSLLSPQQDVCFSLATDSAEQQLAFAGSDFPPQHDFS